MRAWYSRLSFVFIAFELLASSRAMSQWRVSGLESTEVRALVANGTDLFAGTWGSWVSRSSDNGTTWTPAHTGLTENYVVTLAADGPWLFAGASNGVWRTSDNGASWTASSSGMPRGVQVIALVASGPYLLAGTVKDGVFRSSDKGASWVLASTNLPDKVVSLARSGVNIFAGVEGYGVFRSSDNGATWTASNGNLTNTAVHALAVSGTNLFAGTGNYLGAIGESVFRSSDNGANWINVSAGLPDPQVMSFAVSGANLFAAIYGGGIFLSTDNGGHWMDIGTGLSGCRIFSLVECGASLFAGTHCGVWRRPLSEMITGVEEPLHPPESAAVVYPNPFQDKATVHFTTTKRGPAMVCLVNMFGETVARLFEGAIDAGEHPFSLDAPNLPRGAYYVIIREGGQIRRAALTLLR